jgi:TatD DNase family protein
VQESVNAVAKDRLISETDCPYLSPEPLSGRFPNLPENVAHVTKMLALLREEEWESVQKTILANVKRLFFKIGE